MKSLAKLGSLGVAAMAGFFVFANARAQESGANEHEHHATGQAPVPAEPSAHENAQAASTEHVPPLPPVRPMEPMSGQEMIDAMEMDDAASIAMLRFDRLERVDGEDGVATAWKVATAFGGDFDKLLLRSEGERMHGEFERSDAEVLWSHAAASYWDTEVGVRHDFGRGTDRTWAAFGVQGLTPYWFDLSATAYVRGGGSAAFRLEGEYDLSLTQRLILQPRVEVNAYSRTDASAGTGAGLSDAAIGLRLRYEFRRELAPYIGIEGSHRFGKSADYARADGVDAHDVRIVVGVRIWY
jgi:copper resistance protein B